MPSSAGMRTLNLLLLAVFVGLAAWAWPRLPAEIPLHFGPDGRPDRWGEPSFGSWFALPMVAVALTLLMEGMLALSRRRPGLVNLPGGRKLDDLPREDHPRVLDVLGGTLGLVTTELLVVLGLVQLATWRSAMGTPSQALVIGAMVLALLSSPFIMVAFFVRLQAVLDRARRRQSART